MISKHTPAGVYTYASPACRSLLGYDPEELVGRDAYEFFHPDDLEEIGRSHSAILERPDTYTVAYRIRRKDGSYTWFETTSRTVRDPATDEVLEIIAVSRDITERKRTEEALKEALGDAKRYASQLRGLTDAALVVNAAHSVDEMLQTITEQAREVIGAHLCVTSLTIDDKQGPLDQRRLTLRRVRRAAGPHAPPRAPYSGRARDKARGRTTGRVGGRAIPTGLVARRPTHRARRQEHRCRYSSRTSWRASSTKPTRLSWCSSPRWRRPRWRTPGSTSRRTRPSTASPRT